MADAAKNQDPRSRGESASPAFDQPISNIPGKRLVSRLVHYEPGGRSAPHRHAASAFIYAHVISGSVRSQMEGMEERTYKAGETWYEDPGCHHLVSANASDTEPAELLAIFVVDEGDEPLTVPDPL